MAGIGGMFNSESSAEDKRTGAGDSSLVTGAGGVFSPFTYNAPFNIGSGSALTSSEPVATPLGNSTATGWIAIAAVGAVILALPWIIKKLR